MELQEKVMQNKEDPLDAWNSIQPHFLSNLGRAFGQLYTATASLKRINSITHLEEFESIWD
jgi:hypothetical protein